MYVAPTTVRTYTTDREKNVTESVPTVATVYTDEGTEPEVGSGGVEERPLRKSSATCRTQTSTALSLALVAAYTGLMY